MPVAVELALQAGRVADPWPQPAGRSLCGRPLEGRLSGGTGIFTAPYSIKPAGLVLRRCRRGLAT